MDPWVCVCVSVCEYVSIISTLDRDNDDADALKMNIVEAKNEKKEKNH